MNTTEQISYTDAYNELTGIVTEIEQGEITVDVLSEKVKRAAFLIKVCRNKLSSTEDDVNNILKDLNSSEESLL